MIHEISYLETDASLYKLESVPRLNLSDVISHLECNWLFVASGLWSFNIFVINSPHLPTLLPCTQSISHHSFRTLKNQNSSTVSWWMMKRNRKASDYRSHTFFRGYCGTSFFICVFLLTSGEDLMFINRLRQSVFPFLYWRAYFSFLIQTKEWW